MMTRLCPHTDRLYMAVLLAVLLVTPVQAQDEIPWSALSASEQAVLQPFRKHWGSMTAQRQQRLKKGAGRWEKMSPEQRAGSRQRFRRWQELPPEQTAALVQTAACGAAPEPAREMAEHVPRRARGVPAAAPGTPETAGRDVTRLKAA